MERDREHFIIPVTAFYVPPWKIMGIVLSNRLNMVLTANQRYPEMPPCAFNLAYSHDRMLFGYHLAA